ncbi:hypothetical protein SARC_12877 [Sphaeroforma arctica JP610]|uniref:Uncharacterized protein n=1 Tax=Sphaeroforma arctica JP610 TaxID=667725 RepID=A0A0L0FCV4_9EUKA|nr:hypothetical protein SARC_12877 [Sphaeroforma arctica JP610]KNC74582.1 hypothetical protein SARC_12877 [Sphaeroforma arctica JP610]|eukprot:XP_014148484.1 hypothetical protein SARC_12877 [Sphaeroforma arctica JP610]
MEYRLLHLNQMNAASFEKLFAGFNESAKLAGQDAEVQLSSLAASRLQQALQNGKHAMAVQDAWQKSTLFSFKNQDESKEIPQRDLIRPMQQKLYCLSPYIEVKDFYRFATSVLKNTPYGKKAT